MTVLAYLDPGSGSLIAATAAAGLAGVSVAAKSVWHRRTSRFRKTDATAVESPSEESSTDDAPLEVAEANQSAGTSSD